MKVLRHYNGDEWSAGRTTFEDEFGNRGEVRWPRLHNYGGLRGYAKWYDAEVHINTHAEGSADEVGAYAEFALQLAHIGKTLDLAFAEDKSVALAKAAEEEREAERDKLVKEKALQWRCEDVAQFYMQMVRIQREGHSSNAKGELHVVMLREGQEDQTLKRGMWLKESNGNRWQFNADGISKFEVKDGSRYEVVRLTPMSELEDRARKEITDEQAMQKV